jgi:uncharacterized protein YutE (UPF0331/DUF86 family)
VPFRSEIVLKKLLDIDQTTGRLRSWMPISLERLEGDLQLQWAVERGLQIAAETLFDSGNHILAGAFHESVDEYAAIPKRLHARGVLTAATATRLESLAGFRNILVHDYAEVDLQKVHACLQRLDDFEAFVGDVERWLESGYQGGR